MKFILLPWKPELVLTGTSIMGINPQTGKFCSHVVIKIYHPSPSLFFTQFPTSSG